MQPPSQQHQSQARRQRRQRRARLAPLLMPPVALVLLVAAASVVRVPSAHAFLLPAAAPRQQPSRPLTVRHSVFNSFRDEPWFTQDTVHVAEDGAEIMIETRSLSPAAQNKQQQQQQQQQEEEELHDREQEAEGGMMEGQEGAEQQQQQGQGSAGEQGREYKVGIIVVDHGSRRAEANNALEGVVADFRKVSGYDLVEPAHMELAEPSIATAFGRCVEQGATFIVCHPFFLSRGRHVVEDIPTLMEEAASIFPGVGWALSQPLGLQAEIPRLMQLAVQDCMEENAVLSEDHAQYGKDGMGL